MSNDAFGPFANPIMVMPDAYNALVAERDALRRQVASMEADFDQRTERIATLEAEVERLTVELDAAQDAQVAMQRIALQDKRIAILEALLREARDMLRVTFRMPFMVDLRSLVGRIDRTLDNAISHDHSEGNDVYR
jgi:hypothetical protein